MKILALAAALFSLAALAVAHVTGDPMVGVLAVVSMVCTYTTFRSSTISSFLKIFVAIFTSELVVFGIAYLAVRMHWWPASLAEYRLPESVPLTVAMFSLRQRATDPKWYGRAFAVSMNLNFSGFPIGSAIPPAGMAEASIRGPAAAGAGWSSVCERIGASPAGR